MKVRKERGEKIGTILPLWQSPSSSSIATSQPSSEVEGISFLHIYVRTSIVLSSVWTTKLGVGCWLSYIAGGWETKDDIARSSEKGQLCYSTSRVAVLRAAERGFFLEGKVSK